MGGRDLADQLNTLPERGARHTEHHTGHFPELAVPFPSTSREFSNPRHKREGGKQDRRLVRSPEPNVRGLRGKASKEAAPRDSDSTGTGGGAEIFPSKHFGNMAGIHCAVPTTARAFPAGGRDSGFAIRRVPVDGIPQRATENRKDRPVPERAWPMVRLRAADRLAMEMECGGGRETRSDHRPPEDHRPVSRGGRRTRHRSRSVAARTASGRAFALDGAGRRGHRRPRDPGPPPRRRLHGQGDAHRRQERTGRSTFRSGPYSKTEEPTAANT
ncbi:hypothetical protein SAMN05192584_11760 [Streptomyces pini]|uniref:Uncharacterized protein n=1 Tax=Streptomyces pini TaxID=1520580 RepID=A0A1I4GY31_9ACTN|nr:hypothetical protein SAMN05192584_11760 [Streptomyces pini]